MSASQAAASPATNTGQAFGTSGYRNYVLLSLTLPSPLCLFAAMSPSQIYTLPLGEARPMCWFAADVWMAAEIKFCILN